MSRVEFKRVRKRVPLEQRILKGTQEEPLVVYFLWENGKEERRRVINPERSQLLPVYFMHDETVSANEVQVVLEAIKETINLTGKKTEIYNFGVWRENDWLTDEGSLREYRSVDWYVRGMIDPKRNQVDVFRTLRSMEVEPYQIENPHYDVILTALDLWTSTRGEDLNFLIGSASPDIGTIISVRRLRGIRESKIRNEAFKTETYHEFGLVLGIPNKERGTNLISTLGIHCTTDGCSMKQGIRVPYDWEVNTRIRLEKGWVYCPTCLTDLQRKFRPLTTGA